MNETSDTPAASDTTAVMTLADALALAQRLHRSGQLDGALELYRRIIEVAPESADAWHFMGLLEFQMQRKDDGIANIRRALELSPDYSDAHANLANMLIAAKQVEAAETHLVRALELAPQMVPPRVALALIRTSTGRPAESETLLREALALAPESVGVHFGLGNALMRLGRVQEALDHYMRAIVIDPEVADAQAMVGYALGRLGRVEEAADHYRKMLKADPNNPEARHLLTACGAGETPARAADDYVRKTFDGFAASFDAKLAYLEYRAPELIRSAIEQCLGEKLSGLELLDAGCGTGLLGALVRPWCSYLHGVDLSPGMLEKARARAVYDTLEEAELTAALEATPQRYDIVTSADTLCYFGALEAPIEASHRALRPGGWLFFSVEQTSGEAADNYLLLHHGRYAHREAYVEAVTEAAGFVEIRIARDWLRMEYGERVKGLVVAARKGP